MDCDYKFTDGTKVARVPPPGKLWAISVCLILTVLICIPICSFMCMTKKRVYKKSAHAPMHGQGIEVVDEDSDIIAGQPVVEESKQGAREKPGKSALVCKNEIYN